MIYYSAISTEGVEYPKMDDGSRLPWLVAFALLFVTMYFAAAETSLASASRNRIKMAAEHGEKSAKRALYLLDNFDF